MTTISNALNRQSLSRKATDARRAVMYTPIDPLKKSTSEVRADLVRIASEYGPCDVVLADVAAGTPDERTRMFMQICEELSRTARVRR